MPPKRKRGKHTLNECRKHGQKFSSPLGTDAVKEHITDAPWVIVLFRQNKRLRDNGEWGPTYYSQESCGIAAGLFIAAVQNMGLVTLTSYPSPMGFLRDLETSLE